jgi:hypothetical protein
MAIMNGSGEASFYGSVGGPAGPIAHLISVVAFGGVALAVGRMRQRLRYPLLETYAALGAVRVVSAECGLLLPVALGGSRSSRSA